MFERIKREAPNDHRERESAAEKKKTHEAKTQHPSQEKYITKVEFWKPKNLHKPLRSWRTEKFIS